VTELVPSYLTKISRARKHLAELTAAVEAFDATKPYEAYLSTGGKRKLWRYRFTASPENTDIPIVAADVVYNLRSGLDHLAAALVPPKMARHVMFPIFWPGVWDSGADGENEQVAKDRGRWDTTTREMRPEAVSILRGLQPDPDVEHQIHHLIVLNRLSNSDRHSRFPVYASGLQDLTAIIDGGRMGNVPVAGVPPWFRSAYLIDRGEIGFPGMKSLPKEVDIQGTAIVMIRLGEGHRSVGIPDAFENAIRYIETEVVAPLLPYVYSGPSRR
jgi:hypothetical protein